VLEQFVIKPQVRSHFLGLHPPKSRIVWLCIPMTRSRSVDQHS